MKILEFKLNIESNLLYDILTFFRFNLNNYKLETYFTILFKGYCYYYYYYLMQLICNL
jgi:hypothetical protein